MILRKPYAFFIKMFKPIHLVSAGLIAYLIFIQNNILKFLNNYITTNVSVLGQQIRQEYFNNLIYIIPIIVLIVSLLIVGVMFKKKKPTTFYLLNVFVYIVIIIINIYTTNFLGVLEENIVAIKSVKLIHDLVFINIIFETITLIVFAIRGIGINLKKFDFDSDINKINISESDKEEIEINVEIDLNESKRKRKKKLRQLKYLYVENKFIVNTCIICLIVIISVVLLTIKISGNKQLKEGVEHVVNDFRYIVDKSIILNTNYKDKKITDNYLVVIEARINSFSGKKKLYLNDFNLNIGETKFKPTLNYKEDLIDLGDVYEENILSNEYEKYLFVYEIPEKYKNSEMYFQYIDQGNKSEVLLKPASIQSKEISISKKLTEKISFLDTLGSIEFKINSMAINPKYLIEYDYCIKKDDCVKSYEYLKPTINQNFDKHILRLNVNYTNESTLNLDEFYDFFENFASIQYYIDNVWKTQNYNFEEIKSKKKKEKNNVYIGVNSEISRASNIKLVFNIRGSKYEYVIK